jgi:hypothetical protein
MTTAELGRATTRSGQRLSCRLQRMRVNPRRRACAVDRRDAVLVAEHEPAAPDRERAAVERSGRRPRSPFTLSVELAAVARAAEAGDRHDRRELDLARAGLLRTMPSEWTVRLRRAAHVRASARQDREAGQIAKPAVVADVRRPSRHFPGARVGEEADDDELPLRERRHRPDVDRRATAAEKRRQQCDRRRRQPDAEADEPTQGERRLLEQAAPGKPLI